MKQIINGQKLYLKMAEINWIDVALYDEFKPSNVIKSMKLKDEFETWKTLINFCPELQYKEEPKDRDFFFNVLNTLKPNSVTRMLYHANMNRQ